MGLPTLHSFLSLDKSILSEGRAIIPLLIFIEFISLLSSLVGAPALFMAILALPCLFIIPGILLIAIIRLDCDNLVRLVVEGFFVSTLIIIFYTSILSTLGIILNSLSYSVFCFVLTALLSLVAFALRIRFRFNRTHITSLLIASIAYVALLVYFSGYPRFFTPDETSYIFAARQGVSLGTVPPMGVMPNDGGFSMLLQARFVWTYLLTTFLGFTGLPAYQVGLLGVAFLVMTALASSLLLRSKLLSISTLVLVTLSPPLLLFAYMVLNDLAIAFYVTFSVVFFVEAFSLKDNKMSINSSSLILSILAMLLVLMVKPNILSFISMALIVFFVFFKYKLFQRIRQNIFLIITIISIAVYELFIDLPYVISVWVLQSAELGSIFGKFLFISPLERLLHLFVSPFWDLSSATLFNQDSIVFFDTLYTLFSPYTNLITSSVLFSLPILFYSLRKKMPLKYAILASVVILSIVLFYFDAVISVVIGDVSRYSLWLIPLSIPTTLLVLSKIWRFHNLSIKSIPIVLSGFALIILNIFLNNTIGGVVIGYGLSDRISSMSVLLAQLFAFIVLLSLSVVPKYLYHKWHSYSFALSRPFLKKIFICVVLLMVATELYVNIELGQSSKLFDNDNLSEINPALNSLSTSDNLIFANNFIYLRPYLNQSLFDRGLILPPPDSEQELLSVIDSAPNGTILLISNSPKSAWYENANNYIKEFSDKEVILSKKSYMTTVTTIGGENGDISLFKLHHTDGSISPANIVVNTARMSAYSNNTVGLNLQIASDSVVNCSLLLSTDRFTKVYPLTIHEGLNVFNFNYPAEEPNWVNLAQSRVILLINKQIVYNEPISPLNLQSSNFYVLISLGSILTLFTSFYIINCSINKRLRMKSNL
jgi:hypothetical protein